MDYVYGKLATGSKLGNLTVVDMFSRFSPAVVLWFGFRAPGVIELLEGACCEVGYSRFSRSKALTAHPAASTNFGLFDPRMQRLCRTASIGRYRHDRRPARTDLLHVPSPPVPRTSGAYLLVLLRISAPPSQKLEPPAKPSPFSRLKDWRRVAIRYDRCPAVFLQPSLSPQLSCSGYGR